MKKGKGCTSTGKCRIEGASSKIVATHERIIECDAAKIGYTLTISMDPHDTVNDKSIGVVVELKYIERKTTDVADNIRSRLEEIISGDRSSKNFGCCMAPNSETNHEPRSVQCVSCTWDTASSSSRVEETLRYLLRYNAVVENLKTH